jgi:hypothetical protein
MSDDHPIIEQIKSHSAKPETLDSIATGFAVLDDFQRTDVLNKTKAWLDDESATPRQRAQLMLLTRSMERVHTSLRRIGR